MKLRKFDLEETLTDYRCPYCRGRVSSGINDPQGDYDDWIVKPHCTACTFEPSSDKHPFDECIPPEPPEAFGAVLFEYTRPPSFPNDTEHECKKVLLCQVSRLNDEHDTSHWGFGGLWMYQNRRFTPVVGFVCEYRANETEQDFVRRAYKEAREFTGVEDDLTSTCQA